MTAPRKRPMGDMPECYGSWQAIYRPFRRWQHTGTMLLAEVYRRGSVWRLRVVGEGHFGAIGWLGRSGWMWRTETD